MASRAAQLLAAVFWAVMMVLLWKAEYGHTASAGSAVPPAFIWGKMLTAPDTSSLTIFHHGKKIGFCHWMTSVGDELSKLKEDTSPEGMVAGRIMGFRAQVEGNVSVSGLPGRVRFESHLALSTNQSWQEFSLNLNLRPMALELRVLAAEQAVHLTWDDGEKKGARRISFSELKNPAALLGGLAGPLLPGVLAAPDSAGTAPLDLNKSVLLWEGRNDELRIGHSSARAYRLKARLLDRYDIIIFVSRVGEILRINLPDEIVLLNDQFAPPG